MIKVIYILFVIIFYATNLYASNETTVSGLPLGRFVSLKYNKVKLRIGPNKHYNTQFIYIAQHLPLKVIGEYDIWRKVEDIDGDQGWINQNLLSGKKFAQIKDNIFFIHKSLSKVLDKNQSFIFSKPNEKSKPIAKIEKGTIVQLQKCQTNWCSIKVEKFKGWIRKENLWGVNAK